jgi:hypothetical protein
MAKGGKWAFLRGQLPTLPEDPSYDEVVTAMRSRFRHLSPSETLNHWNDLLERKDMLNQTLSGINAEIVGVERVMQDHLERLGMDSISIDGVTVSRKPEPNVKVEDKAALMAWVAEHAPDMASVHHSTLAAFVKAEISRPRGEDDGPPEIPDGVAVSLYEGIARTGKSRAALQETI